MSLVILRFHSQSHCDVFGVFNKNTSALCNGFNKISQFILWSYLMESENTVESIFWQEGVRFFPNGYYRWNACWNFYKKLFLVISFFSKIRKTEFCNSVPQLSSLKKNMKFLFVGNTLFHKPDKRNWPLFRIFFIHSRVETSDLESKLVDICWENRVTNRTCACIIVTSLISSAAVGIWEFWGRLRPVGSTSVWSVNVT